jgi:hypothetical protein
MSATKLALLTDPIVTGKKCVFQQISIEEFQNKVRAFVPQHFVLAMADVSQYLEEYGRMCILVHSATVFNNMMRKTWQSTLLQAPNSSRDARVHGPSLQRFRTGARSLRNVAMPLQVDYYILTCSIFQIMHPNQIE